MGLLLRWVGDDGVLRREWLGCREGYIGRLSVSDAARVYAQTLARYHVFIACGDMLVDTHCYDLSVSRRHLEFRIDKSGVLLRDRGDGASCRGSSNGTLVNGRLLPRCEWVAAGRTGAIGLGGLVLDYCVGCSSEPGVILVSAPRSIDPSGIVPPGWRVYSVRWLPRLRGEERLSMQLVFALSPSPRGSPLDYVTRAAFFARVAMVLGDKFLAEKAAYAAAHAALRLEGLIPSLDGIAEYAEAILEGRLALRAATPPL